MARNGPPLWFKIYVAFLGLCVGIVAAALYRYWTAP